MNARPGRPTSSPCGRSTASATASPTQAADGHGPGQPRAPAVGARRSGPPPATATGSRIQRWALPAVSLAGDRRGGRLRRPRRRSRGRPRRRRGSRRTARPRARRPRQTPTKATVERGFTCAAHRLHDDQRGAEQDGSAPADGEQADLEDDRDQGGDQLDHEEQGAGDRAARSRRRTLRRALRAASAGARLDRGPAEPRAQVLLGPHGPARLRAAPAGHRAGLAAGALGELLRRGCETACGAHGRRRNPFLGAIRPLLSSSVAPGCPRRAPWALTVSMENGAT